MHLGPRCETTLANFEVSLGYKDITDVSVTVKFQLEPGQKIADFVTDEHTYILAWTTTPWTLPGNVALAVGGGVSLYGRAVLGKESYIGSPLTKIFRDFLDENNINPIEEIKIDDLVGKKYKPVFDYFVNDANIKNRENGWQIYAADFVKTEEGTGVVHIAPAFGDDDMQLGKKFNLPFVQHVTRDGKFVPEVKDFAGRAVKPKDTVLQRKIDEEILAYLKSHDAYFSEIPLTHSYPHCWRCDTPLLNYAASSWFVNVAQIRDELHTYNKEITWVPEHIKEGRFGHGLETAPDWAISRSRFWGAPIPVWKCTDCKTIEVAGSLKDLEARRYTKPTTLILARHGERDDMPADIMNNPLRHGEITLHTRKDADVHVTENGKKTIEERAQTLKASGGVDAIYSSEYIRAKETASIFSKVLGVPISYDSRLNELNHGPMFEGKKVSEYYGYFSTPLERFTKVPDGGESLAQARARMMQVAREIATRHEGERVLIVSHGDPLWMLEGALRFTAPEAMLASRPTSYIQQGEMREIVVPNYPFNNDGEVDFHRPYSDTVSLQCSCGGEMQRIPEVFDCWFESGSAPYGQVHYMGKPLENFDPQSGRGFPADFIAEGLDQTRGWFYSLHVLAGALFQKPASTHILVNGLILAENGQKMSKRLKNYPDPMTVVEKYGADALRLYLFNSPAVAADDLNFSERGVDEILKKIIQRLSNVATFYEMYRGEAVPAFALSHAAHVLDKFLVYELSQLLQNVSRAMDAYRLDRGVRAINDFVDMFSTVYLQYSRDRFKEGEEERVKALSTLHYAILETAKIIAPFAPFLAERLYQSVRRESDKESVHLEPWPEFAREIDGWNVVSEDMARVSKSVEAILAERSSLGISVRQPLSLSYIHVDIIPRGEEYRDIVKKRTNIEDLKEKSDFPEGTYAELDVTITPELKEKGMFREFVRGVQDARKKSGFVPQQKIPILKIYISSETLAPFFKKSSEEIKRAVGASDVDVVLAGQGEYTISLSEEDVSISLGS
jgi:isoleucyl-tRNA synthetase